MLILGKAPPNAVLVVKELEAIWRNRMVGARTQQVFWRESMEDPEEELKRIEMEVLKVQEDCAS